MKNLLIRVLFIPASIIAAFLGILLIIMSLIAFLFYSPYYIITGKSIIDLIEPGNQERGNKESSCCEEPGEFYLGTTCPKCNKSFRSVNQNSYDEYH